MIQNVLTVNSPKNSSSRGGGGAGKQREIWTKEATEPEREKQDGYNWLSDVSSPLSMWVRRGWNMLRDALHSMRSRYGPSWPKLTAEQNQDRVASLPSVANTLLTQKSPCRHFYFSPVSVHLLEPELTLMEVKRIGGRPRNISRNISSVFFCFR